MIVAPALKYDTVDPKTGEVITHRADTTGADRERQIQAEEEQAKQARENAKKSPYNNFAQLNLDQTKVLIQLTRSSPRAAEIFLFLINNMDGYNAIVCSQTVLQEALDMSRATVARAIKVLRDSGFIDIKKSGTTNIYLINKEIVWKSWGTNYRYGEFAAKVIVSETEQDDQPAKPAKVKTKKRATAEIVSKDK